MDQETYDMAAVCWRSLPGLEICLTHVMPKPKHSLMFCIVHGIKVSIYHKHVKLESRWVTTKYLYCKNGVFTFYMALWGPCELITYIRVLLTCLLKKQHRCDGFWLKKMHDFTRVGWKSSVIQRGLEVLACQSIQYRPQASHDDGKDAFVLSMSLPLIRNLVLIERQEGQTELYKVWWDKILPCNLLPYNWGDWLHNFCWCDRNT